MEIFLFFTLSFTLLQIVLLGVIAFKIIKKKQLPDSYFTPFDYITSQTTVEYHEEEEEEEQDNSQGDDKNKNSKMNSAKCERCPDIKN